MASEVLGPLEKRVMDHLWGTGGATVRETREALNGSGATPLAYTTVMTILVRLLGKGYVTRSPAGRQFRYAAAFAEAALGAAAGRRELLRLLERHGVDTVAGFAADLAGASNELTVRLRTLAGHDEAPTE